jgi:hypothetical protein
VIAGTCAAPLDLANSQARQRVQSLAITGSGANPTWFWLQNGNNTKYLLAVSRPGNRPDASLNAQIGRDSLHIVFTLRKVASGSTSCGTVDSTTFDATFGTRTMRRDLRIDPELAQFFFVNQETWAAGQGAESTVALWEHSDVVSRTLFGNKPHSGFGWEGNNDSGLVTGDADFDNALARDTAAHNADYCAPGAANCSAFIPAGSRIKPSLDTVVHQTLGRAFDRGDMLPFDWNLTHKEDFLTRLDPEYQAGFSELGDFRIAQHFSDAVSGYALPLVDDHVPLLAADISPLARALTDVRCWYLGDDGPGGNKCKEEGDPERFEQGWSQVACGRDSSFGCRRNFLIVISDGEDNVAGQNANGSIGNLKSQANMVTWALNVGDPDGCDKNNQGGLHSIVQAGGGECVNVETQERLRQVLESLIGQIRTTARSFASAAVPSVQATVEQKIFLTSFLPFNDSPVWKGSVHSFVKPLPVSPAGIPLTEKKCDGTGAISVTDRSQGCHLWDAGKLLFERQYPASGNDYLAFDDTALRRVFYAQQTPVEGAWPRRMRLFDPVEIAPDDGTNTQQVRFDLWRGFGLSFDTDESVDPMVNAADETTANAVVDYALHVKRGTERNTDVDPPLETPHDFLLGDIFHSTPVVIGTPSNNLYFASDLYDNDAECDPDDGTASANPGYRCFFEKQRFRRKMLLVGSNDGMLHAFDAGMFRTAGTDHWTGVALVDDVLSPHGSFDNGTGKELFAYVPRMVLPTLRQMQAGTSHKYTVDGTVTVADVFLDPVRQGSTAFPLEEDREWRTIVVGGLREGGRGYFGLDITQPDPVEEHDELRFVPETADSGSNHPVSGAFVPVCTASLTEASGTAGLIAPPTESGCGPVPFPAVLWEFTDSHFDTDSGKLYYADEDRTTVGGLEAVTSNGVPDLASTWSTPSVGRIRLCSTDGTACDPTPDQPGDDADLVDVFVAVVGGGMDVANETYEELLAWRGGVPADASGNWLYMIDLETGEAIYKQQLIGAAPSEPAAVDTDGDGYLDRIYIGTLAGLLYRVDLEPIVVGGNTVLPSPTPQFVPHIDPTDSTAGPLMIGKNRLLPNVWRPVVLFDANHDGAGDSPWLRPIYQRPSVIFQAGSGKYVLAFGTGDRFDLWNVPEPWPEERFYVFVDRFGSTAEIGSNPLTEADLTPIDPDLTGTVNTDLLASGGWVMRLAPKERVITDAFALSGVMVFSSFVPRTEDGEGNETEVGCADSSAEKVCSKQGVSHVFVVNTTNANGLLFNSDSADAVRYNVAPTFVTNPFAEPGQSKQAGAANEEGEFTADDLSVNMVRVMETLKGLFPPACKFANYRVDIKTVAADTSLQFIAPVPVCLIERNWKEF